MNMTDAAHHLFMSQSAVSQAISDLEQHYKVRLFERLSRKLYLTQAGETLLNYARHMIRLNVDAEHDMRNLNQYGKVRIGASVTICSYIVPVLAIALREKHPALSFDVVEDNTHQIEQLLLCDKLDIGLVEGEILSPELLCEPFATDRLIVVCGHTHPLSSRSTVEAQELEQENFILREIGSGTRKTFEDVMAKYPLKWASSWTCNNFESIKKAVVAGLGLTVISERAVQGELRSGILQKLEFEGLEFHRDFKLTYHKNKYFTQSMKVFLDLCKAEAELS